MDDDAKNIHSIEAAEAANQRASVWMKRGIALLNKRTTASLKEAIGYFDQAIGLRRTLPLDANPQYPYVLAASWMNRGDALTQLSSAENLTEALRSYDAALQTLSKLSLDSNPLFRRRLAIAWQNRGLTLQAQRSATSMAEARRSFETAIATLQKGNASAIADRDYLLAVAWMNYANALSWNKTTESAARTQDAAKQGLAITSKAETRSSEMAEVGLKARHVLCQAIAELLTEKEKPNSAKDELLAEATDAVDSGMALAQSWEQRGVDQFRPLAQELFRFGARAYQIFQPHFLNEFLLENLDPALSSGAFATDARMHAAALESLWRAFRELQRPGFKTINTPQFEEFLGKLRELSTVEERLLELRRQYLATPR